MSEVKRWKLKGFLPGVEGECKAVFQPTVVMADDFDRVTAQNSGLQALLTLADERADVLEGLLRDSKDVMSGIWDTSYDHEAGDALSALDLMERIDAALKPAEAERNQCDGCQAGIPVVNGARRMGKPGGYPDTMSCTAKLYKPAEGGGDEAI